MGKSYLSEAAEAARSYLAPLGYTLEVERTDGRQKPWVGQYEAGSVFSKEIVIRINPTLILAEAKDARQPEKFIQVETFTTVFHEVGHALMEQIIDYLENTEEMQAFADSRRGRPFFDVFNDDNLSEEDLVEEFGVAAATGDTSLLGRCVEALRAEGLL